MKKTPKYMSIIGKMDVVNTKFTIEKTDKDSKFFKMGLQKNATLPLTEKDRVQFESLNNKLGGVVEVDDELANAYQPGMKKAIKDITEISIITMTTPIPPDFKNN